jgi:F0F1-type ATP synthase membrane subunit b/b'
VLTFLVSTLARDVTFDLLVDKVLEKIVEKASAQINDIVDKAIIRLSNHVKDLHQSSISKDAAQ